MDFSIVPKNIRDSVQRDIQVLNSERIIGYNTYNNILTQDKIDEAMNDSDFYNVTVNFIVQRKSGFKSDSTPPKVETPQVAEVEPEEQTPNEEEVVMADDSESPKIIMPNELKSTPKQKNKFDVHRLLQQSRVSKEELNAEPEAEPKAPAQNVQVSEEQ